MVLAKEYRIVLPLSVDEYRCAQVYMTARSSLAEATEADGPVVEVLANHTGQHPQLGKAQYTKKLFHIDKRFPAWLRMAAPKSGSHLIEESWNAFPRVITEVTFPMFAGFRITVQSHHLPDRGSSDPHMLEKASCKQCETVLIDIAKTPSKKGEAASERGSSAASKPAVNLDLTSHRSACGRGPLHRGWERDADPVMCAYKFVKCEFQVWGMQNRIEAFMQSYEKTLIHEANRNIVCWIDEWHGLTLHELRLFEADVEKRINLIARVKQGIPKSLPGCTPARCGDLSKLPVLRAIHYKGRTSDYSSRPCSVHQSEEDQRADRPRADSEPLPGFRRRRSNSASSRAGDDGRRSFMPDANLKSQAVASDVRSDSRGRLRSKASSDSAAIDNGVVADLSQSETLRYSPTSSSETIHPHPHTESSWKGTNSSQHGIASEDFFADALMFDGGSTERGMKDEATGSSEERNPDSSTRWLERHQRKEGELSAAKQQEGRREEDIVVVRKGQHQRQPTGVEISCVSCGMVAKYKFRQPDACPPLSAMVCSVECKLAFLASLSASTDQEDASTHGLVPEGWEVRKCTDGSLYYLDHNTCTSHWSLPDSPE